MSESEKQVRETDVPLEEFIDLRRPDETNTIGREIRRRLRGSCAEFELDADLFRVEIEHIEISEEIYPKLQVYYGNVELMSDSIDGIRPETLIDSSTIASKIIPILHSLYTTLNAQTVFERIFPNGDNEEYGIYELESDTPESEKWERVRLKEGIDHDSYAEWTPEDVQKVRAFLAKHALDHRVYVINDQSKPHKVIARKFPLHKWKTLNEKEKRDEVAKAVRLHIHAENADKKNSIDVVSYSPEVKKPIGEWPIEYASDEGMIENGSMYRLNEEVKRILDAGVSKLTIFVDEDCTELAQGSYRYGVRLFLTDKNFELFMETEGSDFVDTNGQPLSSSEYREGSEAGYDSVAFDTAMDERLDEEVQAMIQDLQGSFSSLDNAVRFVGEESTVQNLPKTDISFQLDKEDDGFFNLDKMLYLQGKFSEFLEKGVSIVHCETDIDKQQYRKGIADVDTLKLSIHRMYLEKQHRCPEYFDAFAQLREAGASPITKLDHYDYNLQYQMINFMNALLASKDALRKERKEELQHLWCIAHRTKLDEICEKAGITIKDTHIFRKDNVDKLLLPEALDLSKEFRREYPFVFLGKVGDDGLRPRLQILGCDYQ